MTAENDEELTDSELLSLPGESIKPGRLSSFFARRSALVSQRNLDQTWLELSGAPVRRVMLFGEQDPRKRQEREDEERRRAWFAYEREMDAVRAREDRLLAYIGEQQERNRERLEDIERRTIRPARRTPRVRRRRRLCGRVRPGTDGRRSQGSPRGTCQTPGRCDRAGERAALRQQEELERLRREIEERRAARAAANDAALSESERAAKLKTEQEALTANEKKFQEIADKSYAAIVSKPDSVADAYSTDYLSAYGSTRTTSCAKQQEGSAAVLAANFTPAAEGQSNPDKDRVIVPSIAPTPGVKT
ncbi:MAG: hypothetical protein M5U33_00465 [Pseudorhodoplanes sp.]|nr:hypothetical protein [Pseudorhodoplanes sp.]